MNNFFKSLIYSCYPCLLLQRARDGDRRNTNSSTIKKAFEASNKPKRFIDARNLINREQIDGQICQYYS